MTGFARSSEPHDEISATIRFNLSSAFEHTRMGFESLGYLVILIVAALLRPIVGLACLIPAWTRASKNEDSTAISAVYWLLFDLFAPPLYLVAVAGLRSITNTTGSPGVLTLGPILIITILCSVVGSAQSLQSDTRATKISCVVLAIYLTIETIYLGFFVIPSLT